MELQQLVTVLADPIGCLVGQFFGELFEELTDQTTDRVSEDSYQLLKFHGSYQQDDRDQRRDRKKQGLDRAWSFMVRTKFPGGRLTAEQYLLADELASTLANDTIRI